MNQGAWNPSRSGGARCRVKRVVLPIFVLLFGGCSGVQDATNPMSPQAQMLANLWWAMCIVATLILLAVMVALLTGVWRPRGRRGEAPLNRRQSRNLVLAGGVILPAIVLPIVLISSVSIHRELSAEPPENALTVEVIGRRWWWEIRYLDEQDRAVAVTANEIHIPVGRPVKFLLKSRDVIHSFWVPNLSGKMDLIPGQTNTAWLTADRAGEFRGQCAEFCGIQHANMAFWVVAEPSEVFSNWLARERAPAVEPADPVLARGQQVFLSSPCVLCHSIRGTAALGRVAPDLTHLASRRTLAAGTLPNNRGNLAGWILDPQHVKPGNKMPPVNYDAESLHPLLSYLESLK